MLVLGLPPEQVLWGREVEGRVTSACAHSGTISVLPKLNRKLSSEQASMGFSRQEYWIGVPSPSPHMTLYYLNHLFT